MSLTRASRASLASFRNAHTFHSSAPVMARKMLPGSAVEKRVGGISIAEDVISEEVQGNDTTSAGHLMLRQKRQHLYYLRLIEHEMPKLVGESYRYTFLRLFRDRALGSLPQTIRATKLVKPSHHSQHIIWRG